VKFNRERAATILAEAAFFGDGKAAEKHGVTVQTIRNYRKRLSDGGDTELLRLLATKSSALTSLWADGLAPAITGCIDFIRRACQKADPANAETIKAINGSAKILCDIVTRERVLNVRLASRTGQDGARPEALAPGDNSAPPVH
jgi:hypothetical protein